MRNVNGSDAVVDSVFLMPARSGLSVGIQENTLEVEPAETAVSLTYSCSRHS